MDPFHRKTSVSSISTSNDGSENIRDFNRWCDDPAGDEERWRRERKQMTTQDRFGSTWDVVVSPGMVSEAISMSDASYGSFVNFGNLFDSCFHYVVPITCRCSKKTIGMVCTKCKITFCDENCLKLQVEGQGILSPEAKLLLSRTQKMHKQTNGPSVVNALNTQNNANHLGQRRQQGHPNHSGNNSNAQRKYNNQDQQKGQHGRHTSQAQGQTSSAANVTNGRNSHSGRWSDQVPPNSYLVEPILTGPTAQSGGNNSKRFPSQNHRGQHNKTNSSDRERVDKPKNPITTTTGDSSKMVRILRDFDDFHSTGVKPNQILSSTSSTTSSPLSDGTPKPYNPVVGRGRGKITQADPGTIGDQNRTANTFTSSTTSADIASPCSLAEEDSVGTFAGANVYGPRPIDLQYELPVATILEMGCLYVQSPDLVGLCAPKGAYIQEDLDKKFGRGSRKGLQPLEVFSVGEYALTQFEDYPKLYRAKILEILEDSVKVYYLDFGNTATVLKNSLLKLPADLLNVQTGTILFGILNVIPLGQREWSDEATAYVSKMETKSVRVVAKYVEQWGEANMQKYIGTIRIQYKVKVWKDLGEILIEKGWAQKRTAEEIQAKVDDLSWKVYRSKDTFCSASVPPQLTIGRKVDASICSVIHLQDFYVTLPEYKRERERIFGELNRFLERKNVADPYNPTKGNICAALINNQWQRVKVLLITKDLTADVFQIDNGEFKKKVNMDSLKEIPDELKSDAGFAYHCKLPIVPKRSSEWDAQHIKILTDMQKSSLDCLQVKCFHIENGIHIVELYQSKDSSGWSQALIAVGDAEGDVNSNLRKDSIAFHAVNSTLPSTSSNYTSPKENSPKESPRSFSPIKSPGCTSPSYDSPSKSVSILPRGSSPSYTSPRIGSPSHTSPRIGSPSYTSPRIGSPSHTSPRFGSPSYTSPRSSSPDREHETTVTLTRTGLKAERKSKAHLPVQPRLLRLYAESEIFTVERTWEKFPNVVFITPHNNQLPKIKAAIADYAEAMRLNPDIIKNFTPNEKDVICMKLNGELVRGTVESIDARTDQVLVDLLDVGRMELVHLYELMPINLELMKFSQTGYLLQVLEDNALDMSKVMPNVLKRFDAWLKSTLFVLNTADDLPGEAFKGDLQVVGNDQILLSQKMMDLTKMQWEQLLEAGYKTPESIALRGEWSVKTPADFYEIEEDMPLEERLVSAKVLKTFNYEGTLNIILLKEEMLKDFKLMVSKLKLYYSKVRRDIETVDEHTDSTVQLVGVRIRNQLNQISKIFDTQWLRAIKCGSSIQSVDDYAEWQTGDVQIAEIRELCPEFLEIPSVCFHVTVPDIELTEISPQVLEKIFVIGKDIKVLLTDVDKQAGEKPQYTAKIPSLEKLLPTLLKSQQS